MPDLVLPRLSDSMEEATVVEWLKQVGDEVRAGDEVAMVETDKATVACEATDAGVLTEILVEAGETVALGAPIARVEMTAGAGAAGGGSAAPGPRPATARRRPGVRAKASPVARRIAREHGIDLLDVHGSGPDGRIVKADLRAMLAITPTPGTPVATAEPRVVTERCQATLRDHGDRELPLTRLQQLIAQRMVEAKATIPDFAVRTEVDMEACAEARAQLEEPTYNDFVIKACALALAEHPRANGSYAGDRFVVHEHVNVGIAVAGEGSLVVPVISDADAASLREIAHATKALAAKAREGTLSPQELEHGTFTVSNLGMFGVTGFTAVVNPPQAAILAVGVVRRQPVVHEDAIVIRHRMEISLTCDHRILYGADAARPLARIRELLESPLLLMY